VLNWAPGQNGAVSSLPLLPRFLARSPESPYGTTDLNGGFSLELILDTRSLKEETILVQAWDTAFGGLRLRWLAEGKVKLELSDGRTEASWCSDEGLSRKMRTHHVVMVVDGGPKTIWFQCDGCFCDGGTERQFGWGRFSPYFRGLTAGAPLQFSPRGAAALQALRIYPRALLAAEVTALYERWTGQ